MTRHAPGASFVTPRNLLLHACAKLGISQDVVRAKVYPYFRKPDSSRPAVISFPPFTPPAWDPVTRTASEQLEFARLAFDAYMTYHLHHAGKNMRAKRNRGVPAEIRYRWAARHLCLGEPFSAIARAARRENPELFPEATTTNRERACADIVQKAVTSVFRKLGISVRT